MTQERLIKKYPNRRLYDTSQSCYITLSDVRGLVMDEIPFKVVDRQTNQDITRSILLQIIMEQESGGEPLFSADLLMQFIRNYAAVGSESFSPFLEQSLRAFNEHQQTINEQMQKALSGTSFETWLKMSEKNMQTWNQMQQVILKNMIPENK